MGSADAEPILLLHPGSADVTFRAGDQVTLLPGFSIQGGHFAVEIDLAVKP